jgi:glycopeptide antibiotics resistance protein
MIKTILYNVLSAFGQAFGFSILLAVLFMFFYMQCRQDGLKNTLKKWIKEFKERKDLQKVFLLAFYAALVLFRTLFNRFAWTNPLQNVIGIFGLYNANGELTTEAIENVILFVPLLFLWLWVADKQELTLIKTISYATRNAFLCSFLIEMAQLLLRVGQVQISDLVYNTLGGIIGGVCYWTTIWVKKKVKQQ